MPRDAVPPLRLFVAAYPPPDAAERLLRALDGLELPDHRRSSIDQLHLTVHFIGDTSCAELASVIESVRRSAAGISPFGLTARRLITLPTRPAARLVAAEFESGPSLLELHRRLVTRLAKNARARETERFRPHMTLCRFRSARAGTFERSIDGPAFMVSEILVVQSVLRREGAEHRSLERVQLQA